MKKLFIKGYKIGAVKNFPKYMFSLLGESTEAGRKSKKLEQKQEEDRNRTKNHVIMFFQATPRRKASTRILVGKFFRVPKG